MGEGEKIARAYLSKLGWAHEFRRTLNTEIYPEWRREEFEAKERQVDAMEEEAEAYFSSEYDRLRKSNTPEAGEALKEILKILGPRNDLGFIGRRIVDRIRRTLG